MILSEKKSAEYITPALNKPNTTQPKTPLRKSTGGQSTGPTGVPEQEFIFAPSRGTYRNQAPNISRGIPLQLSRVVRNFMTFRPRQPLGSGLLNAGTTCFINVALQCLANTQPLQTYILSGDHSSSCKMIRPLPSPPPPLPHKTSFPRSLLLALF